MSKYESPCHIVICTDEMTMGTLVDQQEKVKKYATFCDSFLVSTTTSANLVRTKKLRPGGWQ